jgi:hypothetical protein
MSVFAYILAAAAAPAAVAPAQPPATSAPAELPPELADGRVVDQIGSMVGALSRALLNLPIGELEAAVENRPATRGDKARTVRSVTGVDERELDAEIEQGKVAVQAGSQAIVRSLPVIVEALNKAGEEVERATSNLPQPGYPKR